MTDAAEVLERATAWSDGGRGAALAVVTATWGSSPRPVGSLLAVSGAGELAGSVSGGCVEGAVAEEALAAIRDGRPRRLRYGVSDERAWSLGLACGGTVEVAVVPLGGTGELLAALRRDLAARRPVVLAVELATGAARLLHPLEAGDDPLAGPAREAAGRDRSETVATPAGDVLLRVFLPPVRLLVVGAVHLAQPLARMAALLGLDVRVVDPRRAFATPERFPGVALSTEDPGEALAGAGLDRRTAVVTLSHDPKLDEPALAAALRSEAFYVGALGSRRTQAARRERLAREGLSPAELDRIHGPVGLPLGAVTPAEIAVAILAELVGCLRSPVVREG